MGEVHEDPLAELALRLRTLRAQRSLQVRGLERRTGLRRTTISQALNGRKVPTEATLVALAKALSTDVEPLLALRLAAVHRSSAQARALSKTHERPGWLVRDVRDPFALEVHRAIEVPDNNEASLS